MSRSVPLTPQLWKAENFNISLSQDAIRSIIEAVNFGELDIQIEDVAEKGTAELRLKGAGKEMKRAG